MFIRLGYGTLRVTIGFFDGVIDSSLNERTGDHGLFSHFHLFFGLWLLWRSLAGKDLEFNLPSQAFSCDFVGSLQVFIVGDIDAVSLVISVSDGIGILPDVLS